jgi:hypothetical protein
MRNEGDIRESVADAKMCPNEEFFGRAFGSDISCKRTTRVALFDAESHCCMVPVALMALSRTVNLVTV